MLITDQFCPPPVSRGRQAVRTLEREIIYRLNAITGTNTKAKKAFIVRSVK